MASFDLVSKIDEMELQNALKNTDKQILGRFDFKGSDAKAEYKEKENVIEIRAEDEMKVKAILDILRTNMGKRGISTRGMKESEIQSSGLKNELTPESEKTKKIPSISLLSPSLNSSRFGL